MAIFHPSPETSSGDRRSVTGARWVILPPAEVFPEGIPAAIGQILASRGIVTPRQVEEFLSADLSQLPDPFLLMGMDRAVAALRAALAAGAKIRIFGDYDADGITSTALLVRALSKLGGVVDWYVPHRIEDGYGLNTNALDEALADGVALGITVDNGITALEQLAHAREIGLPMIVTDHHEPGEALPPAVAVLNPKLADNQYPYRELAGVGVAFTLLRALCKEMNVPDSAVARFLDLVTIGTIADVAQLTGENRLLVRYGLPQLTTSNQKAGIAALLRATGVKGCATCADVGFQLGPRLNASGRVAHADSSLKLLLTADAKEAEGLAAQLCEDNTRRQEEELRTLEQAMAMIETRDVEREKILILSAPEWHPGVIGIVASRIVERFNRPCAMIAVNDGVGKGSARARAPFHLWEALHRCAHILRRFGGHQVAAGFEITEEDIPRFREAMLAIADEVLVADDLVPNLQVDAWVDLAEMTTGFARQVQELAPFGMGNPTPVFAVSDVFVQQSCRRGAEGNHASFMLSAAPGGRAIPAIWFRNGDAADQVHVGARVDVAFNVGLNTWQGVTSAQLVVKDIRA